MRYRHCIFDLYGTLVDIRTDEDAPGLWAAMADYYRAQGCDYDAAGLRQPGILEQAVPYHDSGREF